MRILGIYIGAREGKPFHHQTRGGAHLLGYPLSIGGLLSWLSLDALDPRQQVARQRRAHDCRNVKMSDK